MRHPLRRRSPPSPLPPVRLWDPRPLRHSPSQAPESVRPAHAAAPVAPAGCRRRRGRGSRPSRPQTSVGGPTRLHATARRLCPALHAPHAPGRRDGRPHLGHLVCSKLPGRGLAAASLGSSPAGHRRSVSSGKFSPRLTSEHFPFRGGQWESEKRDSPPLRQCGLLPYVCESAGTLPSRGEALHTSR